MESLSIWNFEGAEVRTAMKGNEPWWVLADICKVLDIKNNRDAASRLKEDEKDDVGFSDAIGRQQEMTIINEKGLYRLIFRSNKPEAKRFQDWVFGEVLPAIRKNGYYGAPKKTPAKINIKKGSLVNRERPPLPLASYEKCKLSTYANRKYIQKRLNNVKVWTLHDAVGETGILTNEIYNCCYRNILSSKMWKSLNAAEIMALKWENPYPCEIVATNRLVILYEAGINMLCELYGIDRLYNGVEIERINTKAIAIET